MAEEKRSRRRFTAAFKAQVVVRAILTQESGVSASKDADPGSLTPIEQRWSGRMPAPRRLGSCQCATK